MNSPSLEHFQKEHPAVAARAAELATLNHCLVTAVPHPSGVTLYLGIATLPGAVILTPEPTPTRR